MPDTTGVGRIDSAFARLGAGEIERGLDLLRDLLTSHQPSLPAAVRARVVARLAEATWSLGARDSARAFLREVVLADPFYTPPVDLFNPELRAAYVQVRQQTPVIGLRGPRDTVITPLRDTVPVEIGVGRPGQVQLFLRLTSPRPRDSLLTALWVDSVATAKVSLMAPNGSVLAPGLYAIDGEVASPRGGARALLQLTLERLPVDTTPHAAPRPAGTVRPEIRTRGATGRTILGGVGLGALAVIIPVAVNDGDLSGRSVPVAAGVIGGVVALGNIVFNRPRLPIPENIAYNEALRAQWQDQNRTIAAENATTLRLAPLRVRAIGEP
ncbi:MAG: hypothetical protein ACREMF_07360 [Gemmatimonadales bacterium]